MDSTKLMECKLEALVENEKSKLIDYFDDQLLPDKKKENEMNKTKKIFSNL